MNRTINRTKMLFVALFVLFAGGAWAYQILVITPGKKCEAKGAWWDPGRRICATPIFLPNITGRPLKPAGAAAAPTPQSNPGETPTSAPS